MTLAILLAIDSADVYSRTMTRRGWGDDGIYWVADRKRYVGAVSLGFGLDGKRIRKVVSGKTKQEVKDKLKDLHDQLDHPVRSSWTCTLRVAVDDWLADGMDGRSFQTIAKYRNVLKPVLTEIGDKPLADLTAADIRTALTRFADMHSTDTTSIARLGLERALRHAEANELVARNVASLVDTPKGRPGRPSKSLSLEQASAVLRASREDRAIRSFPGLPPRPPSLMHAYIVLCLLAGIRNEEARALRWDHVDLDGQLDVHPPVPPSVAVWRSFRAHGDTNTERSRRTLRLPLMAVAALREHREHQANDRAAAGSAWQEHGLVFTTKLGTPLNADNVRRMFKDVCRHAGIGQNWTPRELRTSFVSLMSQSGVSTEEIARLVGHSSTRVTETIYRRELRPVISTGAEVMDLVFGAQLSVDSQTA
jgi:integrase